MVHGIIIIMIDILLNCPPPMPTITGKHHVLSASTDALNMDENETYVDMTTRRVQTETIDNIAYEGATSNNEETEGDTHYTNGDFQNDTHIYERI